MLYINRESFNPYFNIAAEEYLIKTTSEPIFMLWQNNPSVIIGKHQNPLREVNLEFVNKNNIPVIRRISGGGTVYHDLGNINYSFIDFGKAESLVNFAKYSRPVLEVLHQLGVDAQLSGKSDLTINGKKFSGNASHVYKNKVLHHGTLLFHSDLSLLNESIKIKNHNIQDKAVNSNRSTVTNIAPYLKKPLSIEEFKSLLKNEIFKQFPQMLSTSLDTNQLENIQQLVQEKYTKWEWNYAYSPKYTISGNIIFNQNNFSIHFNIVKGLINSIEYPENKNILLSEITDYLKGIQHEKTSILNQLAHLCDDDISDQILKILF